jgi:hypothetical protein
MAGDKRKGKAAAEPKKKTRQEKEWDLVLSVADTQGQPQRGIRIGESAQRLGEQPRGEQQQPQQQLRHSSWSQHAEPTETPPSLARAGPQTRGMLRLTGFHPVSCSWVSITGSPERGSQSYFRLTSTTTRSTTLPTRTLRLHVVLTHRCSPQTTRSTFCSFSCSSPGLPGLQTV